MKLLKNDESCKDPPTNRLLNSRKAHVCVDATMQRSLKDQRITHISECDSDDVIVSLPRLRTALRVEQSTRDDVWTMFTSSHSRSMCTRLRQAPIYAGDLITQTVWARIDCQFARQIINYKMLLNPRPSFWHSHQSTMFPSKMSSFVFSILISAFLKA